MKPLLDDLTVIIPYSFDHPDRMANIEVIQSFFRKTLEVEVIVAEINTTSLAFDAIHLDYGGVFHRTRAINDLTRMATTPYVLNWDTDVLCSPLQIVEMVRQLRQGADVVYPYDGTFYWGDRGIIDHWWRNFELSYYAGRRFQAVGASFTDTKSYGGAVGYNKEAFFRAGGENENLISYGPEDQERWHRFKTLGLDVRRVKGPLYHINHHRGVNSSERHPNGRSNVQYWERVKKMNKDELIEHIKSFTWLK